MKKRMKTLNNRFYYRRYFISWNAENKESTQFFWGTKLLRYLNLNDLRSVLFKDREQILTANGFVEHNINILTISQVPFT